MSLSCYCDDYYPDPGDILWLWPNDYSTLATKRSRKCCSCGVKITPGETVGAIVRWKVPDSDIEYAIYGDTDDDGPPRATWYQCETCADLCFSLLDLGFCFYADDHMPSLVAEYAAIYGKGTAA